MKAMWKFLKFNLLISTIYAISIASCGTQPIAAESLPELPYSTGLQEAIDQVLPAYPDYELGISAAVNVPGHQTWVGVSGVSYPDVPVTPNMLFDVGSVQKNFEAALVLKLVEDGKLSLDDPIADYLSAIPNLDGEITIRQLLDHTSGVFNVFEHPDFPWVRTDVDYAKTWKLEEVFNNFVLEPYGPPGYAQHYSSTNYLLITAIIEEVTGSTEPELVERYFIKPLDLKNTYITKSEPPPESYSVAHPWVDIDKDGKLDDLHGIPVTWIASLSHPVIYSTPSDLVRWMNALYYEKSVITSDSLAEMLTYPQTTLTDPDGRTLGLGVVDLSDLLDIPAIGHGGSALGYSAAIIYLPEQGISIAWLINTGESPYQLATNLMNDTFTALLEVIRNNP